MKHDRVRFMLGVVNSRSLVVVLGKPVCCVMCDNNISEHARAVYVYDCASSGVSLCTYNLFLAKRKIETIVNMHWIWFAHICWLTSELTFVSDMLNSHI